MTSKNINIYLNASCPDDFSKGRKQIDIGKDMSDVVKKYTLMLTEDDTVVGVQEIHATKEQMKGCLENALPFVCHCNECEESYHGDLLICVGSDFFVCPECHKKLVQKSMEKE